MVSDIILHRIKRTHSLPTVMKHARVLYTIMWQKNGCLILPIEMCGKSTFLDASRSFTFMPGEGYVGRISEQRGIIDVEILEDLFNVDPRLFLRKGVALLSDVGSILFVKQQDGLLELGFEQPHEAREALSSLVLSNIGTFQNGTSFLGPPVRMKMLSDLPECKARLSQKLCHIQPPPPSPPLNESLPSAGSAGHPHCCSLPCKYVRKSRGCKDGLKCTRCHLCRFTRFGKIR